MEITKTNTTNDPSIAKESRKRTRASVSIAAMSDKENKSEEYNETSVEMDNGMISNEDIDNDDNYDNDDDYDIESDMNSETDESEYEPPKKRQRTIKTRNSNQSNKKTNNNNNNNNSNNSDNTSDESDNDDDNENEDEDIDINSSNNNNNNSDMSDAQRIELLTNENVQLKTEMKSLKKQIKSLEKENKRLKNNNNNNNNISNNNNGFDIIMNSTKKNSKTKSKRGNNSNNNSNNNNNNNNVDAKVNEKLRSKLFCKWNKMLVRVANKKNNKFQRGYGTFTVEDMITYDEFLLCFPKNCGKQTQPTKNNKPKSVVTIKEFYDWDEINNVFNNDNIIGNGKNKDKNKLPNTLKVHVWSVGGIRFSKSRYQGTDTATVNNLTVQYNKSKKIIKLQFSCSSDSDYCGFGFYSGRSMFFGF